MTNRLVQANAMRSTMSRCAQTLLFSTAVTSLAAGLLAPGTAHAADECGPAQRGNVVCNAVGNPFSNGVEYTSPPIDPTQDPSLDPAVPVYDLTVNLGPDVAVDRAGDGAGIALHGLNGGDVAIVSNGSVRTTGYYGVGVLTNAASGGNATVTVNDVSTDGFASHGIYATADAVTVTVNGTVATSDGFSNGVRALASNGGATVTNNGSIVTNAGGGVGIVAYGSDGATVSGSGTIHTHGGAATGIGVNGFDGATFAAASSIVTEGDFSRGVVAEGSGDVTVEVGNVVTKGPVASGIEAATFDHGAGPLDADLQVIATNVTVDGVASQGIDVFSANNGMVKIEAGSVTTHGEGGAGILSKTYTADTIIDVANVMTTGTGTAIIANRPSGIRATSDTGNITISSTNLVSTQGAYGMGIAAETAGAVTINVHDASTRGDAATAISAVGGSSDVTINGNVATVGAEAAGVYANGQTGTATVTNNGSIIATGSNSEGIVALAAGDVTVSGTGSVRSSSTGLDLHSDAGAITVRQAAIVTSGDGADGIAASAGGNVIVDVGSIRAAGLSSTAIRASGTRGADVRVAGAVVSNTSVGVSMTAGDIARLTVAASGSVTGGTDGVLIDSGGGAIIDNAGTIAGGNGYALHITGGPATIANTGAIDGRLLLTGGNDAVSNGGRLTLTGASDFGAGADTLTNSGMIRLATATTVQTTSIAGLEALANSGVIDLRNGVVGDRLTLAGTAYTGTGNATLGLDVAFATGRATADRLILGSATGSTTIALDVSGTPTLFAPVTLVEVGAASSPGAFTLAGGSRDFGLISVGLNYATALSGYQLVSAPSTSVYRQAQLGEALASLWNRSSDAISSRFSSDRDAAWTGDAVTGSGRLWLQTLGEVNTRKDRRDVNVVGLTQQGVNVGYRQDAFGAQIGLDVVGGSGADSAVVGVTGGYLNSTTRFAAGGGDRFEVDAINVGIYAGLNRGPFFLNGLAKYDLYTIDHRSYVAGLNRNDRTHAWGGKVEAGVRLGSASFFAEPLVSLAYSRTALDDFTVGAISFDFDRFDGLRGKAGLRVGGRTDIGGAAVGFYAAGAAIKEFEGSDGLRFSSGGQVVALGTDRLNTFGQGTIGVNVAMRSGVSGFIEAHGEVGNEYRGGGGRAGLRIRF